MIRVEIHFPDAHPFSPTGIEIGLSESLVVVFGELLHEQYRTRVLVK